MPNFDYTQLFHRTNDNVCMAHATLSAAIIRGPVQIRPRTCLGEIPASRRIDLDRIEVTSLLQAVERHLPKHPEKARRILIDRYLTRDPETAEKTEAGHIKLRHLRDRVIDYVNGQPVNDRERENALLGAIDDLLYTIYGHKMVGADQFSVSIPYKDFGTVTLCVTAKGDLKTRGLAVCGISGYGVDSRTFFPDFGAFKEESGDGMATLAFFGAGTLFPDALPLTPEVITDLSMAAFGAIFPQATRIAFVGNSAGNLPAFAAAMRRNQAETTTVVSDNGLSPDIVRDVEPNAFLHKALIWVKRLIPFFLQFSITTALGKPIQWGLGLFVGSLYRIRQEDGTKVPARPEDHDYFRHLVQTPSKPGSMNIFAAMASMGKFIDRWPEYFARAFPKLVTLGDDGRIKSWRIPAQVVMAQSGEDEVFDFDPAKKMKAVMSDGSGNSPEMRETRGSHLPRDPRIIELISATRSPS